MCTRVCVCVSPTLFLFYAFISNGLYCVGIFQAFCFMQTYNSLHLSWICCVCVSIYLVPTRENLESLNSF